MAKYIVGVIRTTSRSMNIEVEADDPQMAAKKALVEATDREWGTGNAEYFFDFIQDAETGKCDFVVKPSNVAGS